MPNTPPRCLIKRDFRSLFTGENVPQLLYVTHVRTLDQVCPRIIHAHEDLAEVVLIRAGSARFRIGETAYEVYAGDLLVYNSGVVHDERSGQENALDSYCVGIGGLRMPGLRENALIPDNVPPVCPMGDEAEDLGLIYDMMYRYLAADRPGCEALCHHLLLALLSRVLQRFGDAPPQQPQPEAGALGREIQEYMDRHFREAVTLQDIGKALHLSTYYLSHVFKEASGYAPMQYLLRRRIGEAQNLLLTTDLSMAQIAEQVGFETQNYFNAQFSKIVGMPPRRYRQDYLDRQLKSPEQPS